ncbi:MAG: tetratricopeptide repeat protein [Spirochaetes bacterium]|nr:tetratricopeptide repeat protein [Spirochaetota bacterium]
MRNKSALLSAAVLAALLFAIPAFAARENSTELYQKGARLAIDGQLDKAILVFKRVVEISPYYCMGHYGLGKAYLHKYGMIDDAVKHLKTAINLDRRLVRAYFYLGVAYFISKKYVPAAAAFKSAYDYDDSYIEALYNLGVVYEIMEKTYEAKIYYDKYLAEKIREEEDIIF